MAKQKKEDNRDVFEKALDDSDEARARRGQQSREASRFMENSVVSALAAMAGGAATKKLYKHVVKPTHSFKQQERIARAAGVVGGLQSGILAGGIHQSMTDDSKKSRRK